MLQNDSGLEISGHVSIVYSVKIVYVQLLISDWLLVNVIMHNMGLKSF